MKVLDVNQIRIAEKTAVSSGLFSYADLMEIAGKAVYNEIISRNNVAGKRFLIIAGNGNNGGDGLVCASFLTKNGALVSLLFPLGMPKSDPANFFLSDVNNLPIVNQIEDEYDYYIDALFGIGLNRELPPQIIALINTVNAYKGIKIAVDVPSGVIADGGRTSTVFNADLTVTFIGYKLCQLLPETSDFCGEVVLCDLGIDVKDNYSYSIIEPPVSQEFSKNSHKGTFGTALQICGSYGMCGAAILAARAAAVSGAGIVKSVVPDKNYIAFTQSVPEAVTIPVSTAQDGTMLLDDKSIYLALSGSKSLLIGCGLGKGANVKETVYRLLSISSIPTVLDADGINAVAADISILSKTVAPLIITPHPGEMARLLNITSDKVESNRVKSAKTLACDTNSVVVLKGANTIVAAPNGEIYFNITGNYGLAKGGSGDVLSGIISALLANGYDPLRAALTAVYIHGLAADIAAKKYSKRGILPSDIISELKYISF